MDFDLLDLQQNNIKAALLTDDSLNNMLLNMHVNHIPVKNKEAIIEKFLILKKANAAFYFIKKSCINLPEYVLNNLNYYSSDVIESSRWAKKSLGLHAPIRIVKNLLYGGLDLNSNESELLFSIKFGTGDNIVESKSATHTKYLTMKQQRSKKKKIAPIQKDFKTLNGDEMINVRYSGNQLLVNGNFIADNKNSALLQYKLLSKNKIKSDNVPITLAKRLLRTKKILVLPAHVNVTAVTNSYDVIHSWFIPGLGLKFDCVPGRSTHHTFFVDSVGFYYGQCAEICGRYHHHMPIRICALPFEHFLVWWQSFGVPKLLFTFSEKKLNNYYTFRKYVW
ncbi:MAG: hypothetical protein Q8O27_00925 [Enterobacteriaceae bacterium]|nr:hypothetical protein [Enterobacteriaceae bacterium]